MQKPKENILSSASNSLLGWLQLITPSLSEFSWLLKRAQKIKKRKRRTQFMPLPHNTISVILNLQLSEVAETENPDFSDCKIHALSLIQAPLCPRGRWDHCSRLDLFMEQHYWASSTLSLTVM